MKHDAEKLRKIARDPIAAAREAKARTGLPVIAALNSWAPDPLVLAAGAIVLRLPAGRADRPAGSRARGHLQAYSCFFCRGVLEAGLEGELDFVDGVLFVQTCDTQQNLSDVWKKALPKIPAADLYVPVNRASRASLSYLAAELEATGEALGKLTGTAPTSDALGETLARRLPVEQALAGLYEARIAHPGRVPALDHYAACIATSCLPPEEAAPLVEALTAHIGASGGGAEPAASCAVAGSTIPYPGFFEFLDSIDVAVKDDDLSLGRRLFGEPVPDEGSPYERLAAGMLGRPASATKHENGKTRAERFARQVRAAGAESVIFPILKFCDPWMWDFPAARNALVEAGLKVLLLELDGADELSSGPVANRLEAHFETEGLGDLFDE